MGNANAQKKDVVDTISTVLRTANTRQLATLFAPSVAISIMDEERQHSKAQSELIIRNFLSRNKPVAVKELHRLTSNPGYKIVVFRLTTSTARYRVMVSLAETDKKFLINEIRIGEENE